MILDEFVHLFAEQFDDTDSSLIRKDTVFQDLDEWGSLTALGIIAFVKTEMGKDIMAKEIRTCETVEDLYNYIMSNK